MIQTLNLFLAPVEDPGLGVETADQPSSPDIGPEVHSSPASGKLKFNLSVVGNALGLLLMAGGAWLSLMLLQVLMVP